MIIIITTISIINTIIIITTTIVIFTIFIITIIMIIIIIGGLYNSNRVPLTVLYYVCFQGLYDHSIWALMIKIRVWV